MLRVRKSVRLTAVMTVALATAAGGSLPLAANASESNSAPPGVGATYEAGQASDPKQPRTSFRTSPDKRDKNGRPLISEMVIQAPQSAVKTEVLRATHESELTLTFDDPITESEAQDFRKRTESALAKKATSADESQGQAAADAAARESSSDESEAKAQVTSLSPTSGARGVGQAGYLPPGWVYCKTGKGASSDINGSMYFSIYCGRTNPRIGLSYRISLGLTSTAVGNAWDTGMRWTWKGQAKPTLAAKSWEPKNGFLTGTWAPIAAGYELTYGDSIYWNWRDGIRHGRAHLKISGTVYPV